MAETKNDKLLLQESDVPESPAVLLIDLSSIAHPIWHMVQQEPDPDCTSQRTAAVVRSLAADHPHTAICCDAPVETSGRNSTRRTKRIARPSRSPATSSDRPGVSEALGEDGFPGVRKWTASRATT